MFVAALVHHYVFTHSEFERSAQAATRLTFGQSLYHLFDVRDVRDHVLRSITVRCWRFKMAV